MVFGIGRLGSGYGGMGRIGGGSFTPASLPNLQLWVKANTGTFIDAGITPATNGQAIQQWNDQSGKGNHLTNTGTSTLRPTLDTTGFGTGKTGVKFTAANFQAIAKSALAFNSTSASVVFVVKPTNQSLAHGRILSFLGNGQASDFGNSSSFEVEMTGGATATASGFGNSVTLGNSGAPFGVTFNVVNVIALVFNGTNVNVYLNGVLQGTATAFTTALGNPNATFSLGSDAWQSAESFDGEMAEVLLYNSALSVGQISQLETYFQGSYGPF